MWSGEFERTVVLEIRGRDPQLRKTEGILVSNHATLLNLCTLEVASASARNTEVVLSWLSRRPAVKNRRQSLFRENRRLLLASCIVLRLSCSGWRETKNSVRHQFGMVRIMMHIINSIWSATFDLQCFQPSSCRIPSTRRRPNCTPALQRMTAIK
jgi:hypothetical protein